MTTTELRALTRNELESMAKQLNVPGRHAMKKEELIKTLASVRRKKTTKIDRKGNNRVSAANLKSRKSQKSNPQAGSNGKKAAKIGHSVTTPLGTPNRLLISKKIENDSPVASKDRLVVQVLDSHWLHAVWSLSHRIIDRARMALGVEWHQAVPIIRVFEVCGEEGSSSATTWVKDIEVSGNVEHWYVPVESAQCPYTLQIGYRTSGGNFFTLASSNKVTTPQEDAPAVIERNQNGRQSSRNNGSNFNSIEATENGSDRYQTSNADKIALQTELVIHGRVHPDSELTCLGGAVSLDESGRFSLRLPFPEGRQVIPVDAVTPDGKVKYTTVLGIVRNTKQLEPQSLEEPLLLR